MDLSRVLTALPTGLRDELLDSFNEIVRNFRENRWEPSELNGGKLCEIVYTIVKGYVDNNYPTQASKPSNMTLACLRMEQQPSTFPDSIRIHIPRVLNMLYTVRNQRGVGHVGGEVDPNHMDALMVLSSAKWLMAELVRIFHQVDTATATDVVEALIERELPIIWRIGDKKRILNTKLTMREKTLLLLYSESSPVKETQLVEWTEHTNSAIYRRDVLMRSHKAKLLEYDKRSKTVSLSPIGIIEVEQKLLQKI